MKRKTDRTTGKRTLSLTKMNLRGWVIMVPTLILFVFFMWGPLASNISYSFYETMGYTKVNFVGLENYVDVLKDPLFIKALVNTIKYVFWSLVIGFLIPIIFAMLLNEIVHFKGFFRGALYLPNIIPGLAAIIIWKLLMDPDPSAGLNAIFQTINLNPLPWLNSQTAVIPLIVLAMTWKSSGATSLIYLAVLQSIDDTYYEAARLEGANVWQRIRFVTIPHILPTIRVLLILQIITVAQIFYEPLVMTGGGPNNASISLLQLIYRYVFERGNVAKGAAIGVIVAIILILLTFIYLNVNKKSET